MGEENEAVVSQDESAQELTKEGDKCGIDVWTSLPTIGGHFTAVQGVTKR